MKEKVAKVIEDIKLLLEDDGLVLELIDVEDGVVSVKMVMNCGSCSGSCSGSNDIEQLRHYIERKLKAELYGIKEVVTV